MRYSIYSPQLDGNTVAQPEDNLVSDVTGLPIEGEFFSNIMDADQFLLHHQEHYDDGSYLVTHN